MSLSSKSKHKGSFGKSYPKRKNLAVFLGQKLPPPPPPPYSDGDGSLPPTPEEPPLPKLPLPPKKHHPPLIIQEGDYDYDYDYDYDESLSDDEELISLRPIVSKSRPALAIRDELVSQKGRQRQKINDLREMMFRVEMTYREMDHCQKLLVRQYHEIAELAETGICENCKRVLKPGGDHVRKDREKAKRHRYRCRSRSYDYHFLRSSASRIPYL